jgi:hypothetical protein
MGATPGIPQGGLMEARGVLIAPSVTGPDLEAIARAAKQLIGLDLDLQGDSILGVDVSWSLVVSVPLAAFLGQLAKKLGEEAHEHLAKFVRGIAKRKGRGEVRIIDEREKRLELVLTSDLPDSAFSSLLASPPSRRGITEFHHASGRWRTKNR